MEWFNALNDNVLLLFALLNGFFLYLLILQSLQNILLFFSSLVLPLPKNFF